MSKRLIIAVCTKTHSWFQIEGFFQRIANQTVK